MSFLEAVKQRRNDKMSVELRFASRALAVYCLRDSMVGDSTGLLVA